MTEKMTTVRIPRAYKVRLRRLARNSYRSMTAELQRLIDQEIGRESAQEAGEAIRLAQDTAADDAEDELLSDYMDRGF